MNSVGDPMPIVQDEDALLPFDGIKTHRYKLAIWLTIHVPQPRSCGTPCTRRFRLTMATDLFSRSLLHAVPVLLQTPLADAADQLSTPSAARKTGHYQNPISSKNHEFSG